MSKSPEEVVMSILADFDGKRAEYVIEDILLRLKELTDENSLLSKYAEQLMVLSGLRKLRNEMKQKVKEMAITIDIENDPFYKEGIEKGVEKGKVDVAKQLLKSKFSIVKVASITGLSIAKVEQLLTDINK